MKPQLILKVLGITFFLSPLVSAGTNPGLTAIEVWYMYNGQPHRAIVGFENTKYVVTDMGWCSHYTATSALKYNHSHIPNSGFPFTDPATGCLVTIDKVKAYYDSTNPNHTCVGLATCMYNCHGYTTGLFSWIEDKILGMSTIKNDDYISASLVNGGRDAFAEGIFGDCAHSYKITGTQSCTSADGCTTILRVSEETEKWGSSPVYKRTYSCEDARGVRDNYDLMKRG
ncbi:MAG TPA: hypothetical protein VMZ06_02890 [Candidatus Bathyarchaeia archaeon]|nr:hypothetical protein [Candidatus Bathyarchaeia archaeon]